MSALARQSDHAALRLAARRSAAGRSRRAHDGALTEMARSLLRDAGESRGAKGEPGRGAIRLERVARACPGARRGGRLIAAR
jgi:hypothetical protein